MSSIVDALHALDREERVIVLFAAESGSRAWGFSSADSDWDIRFVYARPLDGALRVHPGRDTIERMLPGDLDFVGWDVRKALALTIKGNCSIQEWTASPVLHHAKGAFDGEFRSLARRTFAPPTALHHYRSLLRQVRGQYLHGECVVRKKYLYALRPALVLRWMGLHGDAPPPMDMGALLAGALLSADELASVEALVAAKLQNNELGDGPRDAVLDSLIEREEQDAAVRLQGMDTRRPVLSRVEAEAEADALLLRATAFATDSMGGGPYKLVESRRSQ